MADYINKQFEVVGDLILSGARIQTYFEPVLNPTPIRTIITNNQTLTGSTVTLPPVIQNLSLSGSLLNISDGNSVDMKLLLPEIDIQTLALSGTIIEISRGNSINISPLFESIELTGNQLIFPHQASNSSGGSIDLSKYSQTLAITGTTLSISEGNEIDLSYLTDELDNQTLSLSGGNLTISNGNAVDLSSLSQTLSLTGDTLTISSGNEINLNRFSQQITLSGNVLSISDGNSIDLTTVQSDQLTPVFITDITNNNGLIQKVYNTGTVPTNKVISSVTVDDDSNLGVTVEWDGPEDEWMGEASINGVVIPVSSITSLNDTRRFTATMNVDLAGEEQIQVIANGSTHTADVTLLGGGPGVTDVQFGPLPTYQGTQQAMYLDGDPIKITVTFDTTDVTSVSLDGGNDTATRTINNQSVFATDNGDGTSTVVINTAVDTSLSTITQVPVKITAKNSFGTQGVSHTSTQTVPVRQGPEITDIVFGSYPGTQTELKDNDNINITVTFDTNNVHSVQLQSGGNYASSNETRGVNVSTLQGTTPITIDTSVTSPNNQPIRIRAVGGNNNYGNYTVSSNTVVVNNVGPTYSGFNVTYPAGQTALKQSETASVSLTVSNVGGNPTYTYSTPGSQVTIPNTTTYDQIKTVTCTNPGVYNVSSNNYSVQVNRAENNKTTSHTQLIRVVDVLPSISVSSPGSMKSGGQENTSVQIYQITVTSNQQLSSFDLTTPAGAGTLTGDWIGSNNNRTWRRNLQVSDLDNKGQFDWLNLSAINLSNMTQSDISSGDKYTLSGFVSRVLTMSALSRTRHLGTTVGDPQDLTISETFRGNITFDNSIANGATLDTDISTGVDVTGKYTIVDSSNLSLVNHAGDTFFYLDRVAVNNNASGTSQITVQEV